MHVCLYRLHDDGVGRHLVQQALSLYQFVGDGGQGPVVILVHVELVSVARRAHRLVIVDEEPALEQFDDGWRAQEEVFVGVRYELILVHL